MAGHLVSNGKHGKVGPQASNGKHGKIAPKNTPASNDDSQQWPTWQDWAEQPYSWAAPTKSDRSLVRRKLRRGLERQNKPVPSPELQLRSLDLKRLSKGQQAERQSLQRELYQLERALMRTRTKRSKMPSGRIKK